MYYDLVWKLSLRLDIKKKDLVLSLIHQLGEIVASGKIKSQEELEGIFESARDYSLPHMLKDKRFIELVRAVKNEFDIGYKQFLYYH